MKPTAEQWRQRALQDEARRALWLRLDDPGDLPGLRPDDRDFLKSILRKAGERSHRWRPTLKQQRALDKMADCLAGPTPAQADAPRLSDWPEVPAWEQSVRRIVAGAARATAYPAIHIPGCLRLWSRLDDRQDFHRLRESERDFLRSILRQSLTWPHWEPSPKERRRIERIADRLNLWSEFVEADTGRLSDQPEIPDWERHMRRIVATAGVTT